MRRRKGELRLDRFLVPYRVYGEGERAVICVSGAQQTMAAWRPFISRFSKSHAVVVFDPPGLGRASILSGSPHVGLEEQIQVLHGVVCEAAGARMRVLCAASWGTIVAATYAARYPDHVDRMILGSFGMQPNELLRDIIRRGRGVFEKDQVDRAGHMVGRMILSGFGQRVSGTLREAIIRQFEEIGSEQAHSLYHHCGFIDSCRAMEDVVNLRAVRAKTLVINGADDPIIDPQDARRAAAEMPNAEAMIVPDAGHFLHLERPELLDVYSDFIEDRGRWQPDTVEPPIQALA